MIKGILRLIIIGALTVSSGLLSPPDRAAAADANLEKWKKAVINIEAAENSELLH